MIATKKQNNIEVKNEKTGAYTLPYTLKLSKPIQLGSKTLTELEFKYEPTANAMANMPVDDSKQTVKDLFPIIAAMLDETGEVIPRLTIHDLKKCLSIAIFFIGRSEIGDTNSE